MWLSFNILSQMVQLNDLKPEDIALKLTMSTAEIDGIEYINPFLKTVITAKILDVRPHPNADKLTLCDLDTGKENVRVVCGAPNHKKGDIVALATIGTKFNEEFTVKKTKIRGEESSGMLCSEKELGISDDHSGIMILPASTKPGIPLTDIFPNWSDIRLEIDNKSITHRPDLWSHSGFAREIASLFDRKWTGIVDYPLQDSFKNSDPFTVTIKNPDGAPRYCGLGIKNIAIAESPDWLKARVTAIGMRPINNIVDITNYVMVELGEPMHAFDRKKLRGNEIIVRYAQDNEMLTTLDGQEHKLNSEDVVIADKGGVIALAGVMGGGNSEIDDSTTEIILEAANFNPVNIRKTSGRHTLRTEAAIRFEKSLDPELCPAAIIRCYELIKQLIPGAETVSQIIDTYPSKPAKKSITISTDIIRKKLGQAIDDERIKKILSSLDFKISGSNQELHIEVPTYRATKDISIPDDIVEEVGRIYGYDNIKPEAPMLPCAPPNKNLKRLLERKIKEILSRNHNMDEVSNYSFVGESLLNRLNINEDKELRFKNPISIEQDRLRRSLAPQLITNIGLNLRYFDSFKLFELGRVYLKDKRESGELTKENTRVTGVLYKKKTESPLFFDAKIIAIDLLNQLRIKNVQCVPAKGNSLPYVHPSRSMDIIIDGAFAGQIFELHPKTNEAFDIKGSAAVFDLDVDAVLNAKKAAPSFVSLQKFPEVPFEISVLADKFTYSSEICSIIEKSSKEFIRKVDVISIYEGDPIPAGMKSVSVKIIFAATGRTLGPEEIERIQKKVIEDLAKKGFKLRS